MCEEWCIFCWFKTVVSSTNFKNFYFHAANFLLLLCCFVFFLLSFCWQFWWMCFGGGGWHDGLLSTIFSVSWTLGVWASNVFCGIDEPLAFPLSLKKWRGKFVGKMREIERKILMKEWKWTENDGKMWNLPDFWVDTFWKVGGRGFPDDHVNILDRAKSLFEGFLARKMTKLKQNWFNRSQKKKGESINLCLKAIGGILIPIKRRLKSPTNKKTQKSTLIYLFYGQYMIKRKWKGKAKFNQPFLIKTF